MNPNGSLPEEEPLRVLVNAVAVGTGGGGTFVVSQLAALARRHDVELTVYARGHVARELRGFLGSAVRATPSVGLIRRLVWENVVLARKSRLFDVLYCAGNFALPLARVPQVVMMQNALHFGAAAREVRRGARWHQRLRLSVEAWLAQWTVGRAFAVAAVSNTLRAAIIEDTGDRAHVRVIPAATPELPHPQAVVDEQPYVVSVAHDHPHKDWDRLIKVFAQNPDLPPLVAVGAFAPDRRARLLEGVAPGRVRFRGVVEDRAELAGLYAAAACCVVHSRIESFGLTALEALAAGLPVLASDIPAHREVCKEHANLYDPTDMNALTALLRTTLENSVVTGGRSEPAWTWHCNARELTGLLKEAVAQTDSRTARSRRMHNAAEN